MVRWGMALNEALNQERPRWSLWIPLAFGTGIGLYLAWPLEPSLDKTCGILGGFLLASLGPCLKAQGFSRFMGWATLWITLGFGWAMRYAHLCNPRPLTHALGPIWVKGIVRSIDHTASRHTLFQRLVLCPSTPKDLPKAVTLQVRTHSVPLYPGDTLRVKAKFEPLAYAALDHAYDSQRENFFRGIGAVGYALSSIDLLERHSKGFFAQKRHDLTRIFYQRLPAPLGAMACALVTGDKMALDPGLRQDFSDSGLSHILAIAGLHMALLSGICFFLFRQIFIFRSGLFWGEILGGILTLGMGWIYMMLSGQRYPTMRAFTMMVAASLSLWIGRPRQPLRLLLFTAMLFLIFEPYAWATLSYQLSFGAVAGLMSIQPLRWQLRQHLMVLPKKRAPWVRKSIHFIKDALWANGAIVLATWPIMAYHFSHVSFQGVISNMIAIPWTAIFVLPLGLMSVALLSVPYLSDVALTLWGWSLQGLILMAQGSARSLKAWVWYQRPFSAGWLYLEMMGLFWFFIWKRPWRWAGLGGAIILHLFGQIFSPRPDILWTPGLLGVLSQDTLRLSSMRSKKFQRQVWMRAYNITKIEKLECPTTVSFQEGKVDIESCEQGFLLKGPFGRLDLSKRGSRCAIFGKTLHLPQHNRLWNSPRD